MKTEYRIIPYRTYIADKYLQFKDIVIVKPWFRKPYQKEVWRFIPRSRPSYPAVHGYWLYKEDCPTSLPYFYEHAFLNCFNEQEDYDLIPFSEEYKDINDYFKYLRKQRKEYLEKEEKAKNMKTKYL